VKTDALTVEGAPGGALSFSRPLTWTRDVEAAPRFPPTGVSLIHTGVPGRVRIQVAALKKDSRLKRHLERSLRVASGVHSVAASEVTGNVLVHTDRQKAPDRIVEYIKEILSRGLEPAEDEGARPDEAWHCMAPEEVAARLESSAWAGLTEAAASERVAQFGENALASPTPRSGVSILADQFSGAPVALLGVASIVSLATGALLEAAAILSVVFLNAAIGYVSESRAERTIEGLGRTDGQKIRVIRADVARLVPSESLVPGDLICLQRGDVIPADARLVTAHMLSVSEAALTGESQPVSKAVNRLERTDVPLAARANLVYRGTLVTGGSGTAIVFATGLLTEIGRIQRLVGSVELPQTPMQRQLEGLGTQIAWLSVGIAGLIFGVGVLRGYALLQIFRSGLSLAVAAVPEGLPMVATTTLVLAVDDMRRRGMVVRRLDAIETLASVKVVCFDKTGTLTLNRMSVVAIACDDDIIHETPDRFERLTAATGGATRFERLLSIAVLCSDAEIAELDDELTVSGSSTESALVRAALDAGIDARALRRANPLVATQHRTEIYRFMATTHARDGGVFIAVKGSPLDLLRRCRYEETSGGVRELTPERRRKIEVVNAQLAGDALRVLGFAWTFVAAMPADPQQLVFEDLTWVGLAGLADPLRPGMRQLMSALHSAGVHTVMITGDQPATAAAVAAAAGMANGCVVKGYDEAEINRMSDSELGLAAQQAHIFSRVSPAQKLRIIDTCRASGGTVAMIGDGVNDSPALRSADVGIALGREGTNAAREVADVVLETDELMTLVGAIEKGRMTRTNIRRSIHYLLSTNLSECVVMLSAAAAGVAEAMTPMQLLWINLVTDILPGMGLALEPAEQGTMCQQPHSADAPVIGRQDFAKLGGEAAMLSAGSLAASLVGALRYGGNSPQARTMTFASLVTAQLMHALTYRSHHASVAGSLPVTNRQLVRLLGLAMALQGVAFLTPFMRRLLGLAPLSALDLLVTLGGGLVPYLATEAMRASRASRASGARNAPSAAPLLQAGPKAPDELYRP
jgi:Ca2+-transporting ATPase